MDKEKWQEILDQNDLHDVLTEENYNEDYSHSINLTVKEIRQIANLLEPPVLKKIAGEYKNILTEQARHYLGDCLNELKYSRPAWEQKLIHTWISEWNAQKVILLGDTWTAEDILGDEE